MPKFQHPDPRTLISTAEVSRRLGKDIRTVHRMAADGRLTPVVRVPGKTGSLLFDPAEVEALMAGDAA